MIETIQLKEYLLKDIKNLKIHGRTINNLSPLTLFWTASGIELNAKGSELWIEVEVDYNQYEPWISVLINGADVSRQMLIHGRYWVCIFRGMNKDAIKNVQILKEVQPMQADPNCRLQIHSLRFDGEFLPVKDKPYKIEFIGDSITSAEGIIGAKQEEDWLPMWMSAVNNYARLTADFLNAEVRILSQGGWGVLQGWDNNPNNNMPSIYEKICGPLTGEYNIESGALEEYGFSSWQPDVIVVNLGTNDFSGFNSPEWIDEKTGKTNKLHRNADGSLNEDDLNLIQTAVTSFMRKIRSYNKTAYILWAYGTFENSIMNVFINGVNNYREESKDTNVEVTKLPLMTEEMLGSRSHPGVLYHKAAAEWLVECIKPFLKQ
jgi:hypothetical protein